MRDLIEDALDLIGAFGGTDGGHHKQWVLDQVVRILTDCPSGRPFSYTTRGESEAYKEWKREYSNGEDGPDTYGEWDEGIAP